MTRCAGRPAAVHTAPAGPRGGGARLSAGSCAPQFGEDAIKEGAGAGGPSGMEDLFSMFTGGGMGGRRGAPRERRGENVVHRLKVGLEEMYIGSTRCAYPSTDPPDSPQAPGTFHRTCRTGWLTSGLCVGSSYKQGRYRQGGAAATGPLTGAGAEGAVRGAQEAVPGAEHQVRRVRGPGHKVGEAVPLLGAPPCFAPAASRCRCRARLRVALVPSRAAVARTG